MDYELLKNLALLGIVFACVKLWHSAFLHYKYVMVKQVALGKRLAENTLTIEQIIKKTQQEVREENDQI